MGHGFGAGLWESFIAFVIVCMVGAFALGALAMWGLPKLWDWLAPIIHAATA